MSVNSPSPRPPVGRRSPVQGRSRRTVERILDAAAHVFAERGYAATTNQVAEQAGLSIGSLYQYFRDKDELLVALHARHLDDVQRRILQPRAHAPDGDAWVAWLLSQLIDAASSEEAAVLWSVSRGMPTMRSQVSSLVDDLAVEAAVRLRLRSPLAGRAVVVTALALVHEVVMPTPTPTRRRIASASVMAVVQSAR